MAPMAGTHNKMEDLLLEASNIVVGVSKMEEARQTTAEAL
jgi:hypothetical protein